METPACPNSKNTMSLFERYLTLWVALCMIGGIILEIGRAHV